MKLTPKQWQIVDYLRKNGASKKAAIVDQFGHWYQYGKNREIGNVLSRMVNANILHRPQRGFYDLGPDMADSNQLSLF